MTRIIGSVLIIISACAVGVSEGNRRKKRIDTLEQFVRALEFIKSDICIMDKQMKNVLNDAHNRYPLNNVFLKTADRFSDIGLEKAWRAGIDEVSGNLCLKEEDTELIKLVGDRLGKTHAEDQRENIERVIQGLYMNLAQAKEDYEKNGKLIKRCSLLLGVMTVILLI